MSFLMSFQGIIFILLTITILLLSTIIELFGFIQISAQSLQREPESGYWSLVRYKLKSLPRFFDKGIFFILIYVGLLIPLTGAGTPISHLQEIRIPRFIMSVINTTPLYLTLYLVIFFILTIIGFYLMFALHFMVLLRQKPSQAIRSSITMVRKNLKPIIFNFAGLLIIVFVLFVLTIMAWVLFVSLVANKTDLSQLALVFLLMLQYLGMELGKMVFVPFETLHLTHLFYKYGPINKKVVLPVKTKTNWIDRLFSRKRLVLGLVLAGLISFSFIFSEVLANTKIFIPDIIAHRGGEGNENSLSAIKNQLTMSLMELRLMFKGH